MKRIFALLIMALMVAILLPSCTENQRAKRFGGKMEYQVPKGEEFVNATWKDANLWIITKNQTTDVGSINGPRLLKSMTKEAFEAIKKVDSEFAKIVKMSYRGEDRVFLTTFLRRGRHDQYTRSLYDRNENPDPQGGVDVPSIRFEGKQLTFKQFEKWRENFKSWR